MSSNTITTWTKAGFVRRALEQGLYMVRVVHDKTLEDHQSALNKADASAYADCLAKCVKNGNGFKRQTSDGEWWYLELTKNDTVYRVNGFVLVRTVWQTSSCQEKSSTIVYA